MNGSSELHLVYQPPSLWVWTAPETVRWYALLVLGAVLAVVAVRLMWAVVMFLLRNAPEDPGAQTPEARNTDLALTSSGYRFTGAVFGFAVLLFAVCLWGLLHFGRAFPGATTITVNTRPGLPAATALLLIPSFSLTVGSALVLAIGATYGAALGRTRMLPALWLLCGAAGCGVAALLSGGVGCSAATWRGWLYAGLPMAVIGLALLVTPSAEGVPTLQRARGLLSTVKEEVAEELAREELPSEGIYVGDKVWRYWSRIVGALLITPLFLGGAAAVVRLTGGTLDVSGLAFFLPMLVFGTVLYGVWAYVTTMRYAQSVRWNREGIEVAFYRGRTLYLQWDELADLRITEFVEHGPDTAWVRAASGEAFKILRGRPGYDDLVRVLKRSIWGKEIR
jgi:hypothetical protein